MSNVHDLFPPDGEAELNRLVEIERKRLAEITTDPVVSREKAIATARAKAALIGASLIPSKDDRGRETFILSRWTLTREFASLEEAETVIQRMSGEVA